MHEPANPYPFGDLATIPHAVDRYHEGLDPYAAPGTDASVPAMNYPRAWIYLFAWLHMTAQRLVSFGLVMAGLYLACISRLIASARSAAGVAIIVLAACSSSSLLALERGNTDLLSFSLVYLGAQSGVLAWFVLLVGVAAIFKLYPVAALLAGLLNRRWHAAIAVAGVLLFGYFVLQRQDIAQIVRNTPTLYPQSYGVRALADGLTAHEPARLRQLVGDQLYGASFVASALVASLAFAAGILLASRAPAAAPAAATLQLSYGAAACIFLGTFFLSFNFDYRLIFLIPLLPFYVGWLQLPRLRVAGIATTALILLAMNNEVFENHLWHAFCQVARLLLVLLVSGTLGVITRQVLMSRGGLAKGLPQAINGS